MANKEMILNLNLLLSEVKKQKREILSSGRQLSAHELKSLQNLAKAERHLQETKHELYAAYMQNVHQRKKHPILQHAA